jgi:hypothetical protein
MRLRERFCLVREKHDAELTYNGIERSAFEGQLHGVGLTPFHGPLSSERGSLVKHRLIQIRSDDGDAFWQDRS